MFHSFVAIYTVKYTCLAPSRWRWHTRRLTLFVAIYMVKYGTNAHLCAIHTVKHLILIAFVAIYMVKYGTPAHLRAIYTVKYIYPTAFCNISFVVFVTFFLQIIGVLPYESLREASISAAWRST